MIKVIDIELTGEEWIKGSIGESKYWTNNVINKFINNGWNIRDWKIANQDILFILEKPDIPNENINNT